MRTDTQPEPPVNLSVLSCAYNEEANISEFLSACLESEGTNFELNEVLVVASGCTDRTEEIVRRYQVRYPKIKLISQPVRTGKVTALLEGLRAVTGDVVLVENADTIPSPEAFDKISAMFREPGLDLVGAHPLPVADVPTLTYQLSKMIWDLHDAISVNSLKVGEAYAIRAEGGLRLEQCEDDDSFLSVVSHAGRVKGRYARDAVIFTTPASSFEDLWNHRYRIARHLARRRKIEGEGPSTWDLALLLPAMLSYLRAHPRQLPLCALGVALEATARIAGQLIVAISRVPFNVWYPLATAKRRTPPLPGSQSMGGITQRASPEIQGRT